MSLNYPSFAKSKPDLPERKDALVPDPQEYDMSDPDAVKSACQMAADRLHLFERLISN